MNPSSIFISRRLLQVHEAGGAIHPISVTSAPSSDVTIPWTWSSSGSSKPLTSSIAFTLVISFTAFFFIAFVYAYIRRHIRADAAASEMDCKRCGLDASVVSSLPMVAYGKAGARRTADECTICLCEFDERETIKIIPYCSHVFHPRCIDTWLVYHVTCPICRTEKMFEGATAPDVEDVAAN